MLFVIEIQTIFLITIIGNRLLQESVVLQITINLFVHQLWRLSVSNNSNWITRDMEPRESSWYVVYNNLFSDGRIGILFQPMADQHTKKNSKKCLQTSITTTPGRFSQHHETATNNINLHQSTTNISTIFIFNAFQI